MGQSGAVGRSPGRKPRDKAPLPAAGDGAPTRRDEILAIARATFARRGYSNTSMRDIAEASGLLAGSLYSHFRSKSEILRLILEPLLDRMVPTQEAVLRSGGTGLERLQRMIREVLAILVEHQEEITIMHYDWSELSSFEDLAPVTSRSNRLLDIWYETVADGISDGSVRSDVDPYTAVRAVTSSLHAAVDRKRFGALPGRRAAGQAVDELAGQLDSLFTNGLAAPKGPGPSRRRAMRGDSRR